MKLRNWFYRHLAEKELIEWKPDYYNEAEKKVYEAQQEELRRLESGEEIAPPWHGSPSWNNPARFGGDSFHEQIWETFWTKLNDAEKREYLKKHKPSPEDWYQVIVKARTLENESATDYQNEQENTKTSVLKYFNLDSTKEDNWLKRQILRLTAGEEIEPPWITFPISLPAVGWNDHFLENWKLNIWIPFWDTLDEVEKKTYLQKYPPPDQEWRKNITENWTGKIRKTEDWFERQRMFLQNRDDHNVEPLNLPRYTFPHIPSEKTFWDESFIDRWLTEIWLPFWNGLTDEQQDEQLKYIAETNEEELQRLSRHEVRNIHKFKM